MNNTSSPSPSPTNSPMNNNILDINKNGNQMPKISVPNVAQ